MPEKNSPGAVAPGPGMHDLSEGSSPARQCAEPERRVAVAYGIRMVGPSLNRPLPKGGELPGFTGQWVGEGQSAGDQVHGN